jgi:hypothetical protein
MARFSLPVLLLACPRLTAAQPPAGTLTELQPVSYDRMADLQKAFSRLVARDLGPHRQDFEKFGVMTAFQRLISYNLGRLVPSRGLKYASTDAAGRPRLYSGRVFLPSHTKSGAPLKVPLLIYQHATETERKYTPYYDRGDEAVFGALGAELCGFAVAMPDGDGMGADPSAEPHAYCHGATSVPCLIDLIRALTQGASGRRVFDGVHYAWDGQVFIMGYSEGGYIAMAAVKELTTNPAWKGIPLAGAACMGGPAEFSATVRTLLKDPRKTYARPYIPAYLIATWQHLYPDVISMAQDLNPKLLEEHPAKGSPDPGSIYQWMDGAYNGDKITQLIQFRLTGNRNGKVAARAIARESWLRDNLDKAGSRLNQVLRQNDVVGDWAPKVPVLLAHDPQDALVPYSNSQDAFDSWKRRGGNPYPIVRLELGGRGSGHVGGAVLSLPLAFAWFKLGMPRSADSMSLDTLLAYAKDHTVGRIKEQLGNLAKRLPGGQKH